MADTRVQNLTMTKGADLAFHIDEKSGELVIDKCEGCHPSDLSLIFDNWVIEAIWEGLRKDG